MKRLRKVRTMLLGWPVVSRADPGRLGRYYCCSELWGLLKERTQYAIQGEISPITVAIIMLRGTSNSF
jgi:hypothetical protein